MDGVLVAYRTERCDVMEGRKLRNDRGVDLTVKKDLKRLYGVGDLSERKERVTKR